MTGPHACAAGNNETGGLPSGHVRVPHPLCKHGTGLAASCLPHALLRLGARGGRAAIATGLPVEGRLPPDPG